MAGIFIYDNKPKVQIEARGPLLELKHFLQRKGIKFSVEEYSSNPPDGVITSISILLSAIGLIYQWLSNGVLDKELKEIKRAIERSFPEMVKDKSKVRKRRKK